MTRTAAVTGALVAVAAVFAGLAIAGQDDEQPKPLDPAVAAAKKMSTSELVGQRIVTGYVGETPPRSILRAVKLGHFGGVILFANNIPSPSKARRSIAKLQKAAKDGGQPPLFVMVDQEGGIVQRMPTLPPNRTPAQIGRSSDPAAVARKEGTATGRALRKYGFNVNLAPVVDIPRVRNSFLGNRTYSRSAKTVADAGCAFAGGLESTGTASSFKHFPGLGHAGADTDFNDVNINAPLSSIEQDWSAYKQCPDVPAMVMMSSARYPKAGIRVPSSLTKKTYDMLATTGFKGLTITDALETPQFKAQSKTGRRALLAGVDILLYGQAYGRASSTYKSVLKDARSGVLKRADLEARAAALIVFKDKFN